MTPILRAHCQNVKATADRLGIRYRQLADALNLNEPQPFHADWLPGFLDVNGDDALRWLCHQRGGAFTPFPAVPTGAEDLRDRFMKVVEEVGKDSSVLQRALADNELTVGEGDEVLAELENTIDVLRQVGALVLAKVKPAPARMTLPAAAPVRKEIRA